MAPLTMTDAKIYLGGYNLSGYANELMLSITPELLDNTVFGTSGTRSNKPGLKNVKAEAKGFTDYTFPLPTDPATSLDKYSFERIGAISEVFSAAPIGNAEDDVAYFVKSVQGMYNPVDAKIGQLAPWNLDVMAAGVPVVRGYVGGVGAKIATGQGTGRQFAGGVAAGQYVYAALHVVASSDSGASDRTLDVIVQSDDNSGFTTPVTRLTFPQFTTSLGASWQALIGPITDDYYRIKWTIAGTTPSFTIFASIGIL